MPGKIFDWMMSRAELLSEPTPGTSLVEIVGDSRVLIENHKGVTSYDKKNICIKTTFGVLTVTGEGLELACMSKNQLVITGCVVSLSLFRGHS